ncbi:hypothetical protein CAPTEDRAFT_187075 [Capitella teleta]|uniref:Uncharacterized protein n=1 Tax=Capitella teleta TaxID=283909 RepID=R7U1G8_CAPTE|nr:hypothetical protein CAPTEDRAFT_187075 [Capitella teleta]|eukprot:ELT97040.1 hypothetical protein CAPTEDRAFT_187075 [Capitella teleta]
MVHTVTRMKTRNCEVRVEVDNHTQRCIRYAKIDGLPERARPGDAGSRIVDGHLSTFWALQKDNPKETTEVCRVRDLSSDWKRSDVASRKSSLLQKVPQLGPRGPDHLGIRDPIFLTSPLCLRSASLARNWPRSFPMGCAIPGGQWEAK